MYLSAGVCIPKSYSDPPSRVPFYVLGAGERALWISAAIRGSEEHGPVASVGELTSALITTVSGGACWSSGTVAVVGQTDIIVGSCGP